MFRGLTGRGPELEHTVRTYGSTHAGALMVLRFLGRDDMQYYLTETIATWTGNGPMRQVDWTGPRKSIAVLNCLKDQIYIC